MRNFQISLILTSDDYELCTAIISRNGIVTFQRRETYEMDNTPEPRREEHQHPDLQEYTPTVPPVESLLYAGRF